MLRNLRNKKDIPITDQAMSISEENTFKTKDISEEGTSVKTESILEEDNTAQNESILEDHIVQSGLAKLVKWREETQDGQRKEDLMLLTLSLHKTNPYVYQYTKNRLSLPTPNALRKFFLPLGTVVDQRLINILKTKANEMTRQGKICSISVDCIPVKQSLFYDISNDRIIGFSEVNGIQQLTFANYAVVVMAQGIMDDWQQLIAHCFLDNYEHHIEVTDWIREILTILIEIGFDVRAFVTDQSSNIATPKPINAEGSFSAVTKQEICRVFDTPRLIQCLRIHLNTCLFIYKDGKILTTDYLENRIESLEKILTYKEPQWSAINASLEDELKMLQLNFLTQMLELFNNLRLVDINSGVDVTATTNFITGFQVTIKSILQLHESFKSEGLDFRHTSRLTLDAITNIFKNTKKKGSCQEITCRQISKTFRKSFLGHIMNDAGHDQVDLKSLLEKMEEYSNVYQPLDPTRNVTSLAVETTEYKLDLPDKQVISYISKCLYRKCFDRHSHCLDMNTFLSKSKTITSNQYRYYGNVSLYVELIPPDCFTDYIFLLEKKFQDYFNEHDIKNVGNDVYKSIGCVIPGIPCRCFPFDYGAKLFIRFRIYYTIKINNKRIKQNKDANTSFTAFKLTNKF